MTKQELKIAKLEQKVANIKQELATEVGSYTLDCFDMALSLTREVEALKHKFNLNNNK